ncbi:MAG: EAL domain-containing protein [Nocardioidaceae bacterium]|nr:EAL domain-containing protein [Nocardioidaceae bacterium]MCL2614178.1 EAL domain-containing protein [Nocardioidaceae bacterium]
MDGDDATHAQDQGPPPTGLPDAHMRLLVEAAPNALVLVDSSGRIVLVNREAERSFGYSRDELMRMWVDDLVPDTGRGFHQSHRALFATHPSKRTMGAGREMYGVRKDGTHVPVEVGLSPVVLGKQPHVLASVLDISERRRGQSAADEARQARLMRDIIATLPISVIATDLDGRVVTANPAAERLLGYQQSELVGGPITVIDVHERMHDDDGNPALRDIDAEIEWSYRRKDGSVVPVSEEVVLLRGADGHATGYLVVSSDITNRVEAYRQVDHLRLHDPLTNLPNREHLLRGLEEAVGRADEAGTRVAVLLLDLDHFKRVNDTLGHHLGDELLLAVADRLRGWARSSDIVGRLGGDEFVVILTDLLPGTELTPRIEDMLASLLAPVDVRGYELVATASVGATVYPTDGGSPATLLRHADAAMFRAKAAGRDTVRWFDTSMQEETNDKLALSGALRHALGHGELSVVYQPQFDLADGELIGFEALARWQSSEYGAVSPDRFIPVAEDSGLILQLGEWVLRRACADLLDLQQALGRPLNLAVNVSPRQLHRRDSAAGIAAALEEVGLAPDQLGVEITEGILLEENAESMAALHTLRDLGVQVIVDDFGRGYSSLAYLTRFPVDKIKIDRSFVQPIADRDETAAIVDAIIVMAHALGMTVVAEGVETEEQEAYLRARGCDQVQGYRYGRGVPLAEAARTARTLDA